MSEANAAVLDAPAESETQTPPQSATQADDIDAIIAEGVRGTDAPVEAQTDAPPAVDAPTDRMAEAIEAARTLALEEGREAGKKEALEEKVAANSQATVAEFKQHYPRTAQAMRQELANLGIVDPQEQQMVLRHADAYNLRALEAGQALTHGPIEDAIEVILPKDAYAKFAEDANGKSPKEFLEALIEHGALRSKAVKGLTLEEAMAHSGKLKAEITKALADAEADGRKKGRNDPPGDGWGGRDGPAGPKNTTYAQIQKMTPDQAKNMSGEEILKALDGG